MASSDLRARHRIGRGAMSRRGARIGDGIAMAIHLVLLYVVVNLQGWDGSPS